MTIVDNVTARKIADECMELVYWRWFLGQHWCDEWPDLVEYANLVEEG